MTHKSSHINALSTSHSSSLPARWAMERRDEVVYGSRAGRAGLRGSKCYVTFRYERSCASHCLPRDCLSKGGLHAGVRWRREEERERVYSTLPLSKGGWLQNRQEDIRDENAGPGAVGWDGWRIFAIHDQVRSWHPFRQGGAAGHGKGADFV